MSRDRDADLEAASPAGGSLCLDGNGNLGRERVGWNSDGVSARACQVAVLHGHQLAHHPEKGDLEACCDANEDFRVDQLIDILCCGAQDAADKTDDAADDEEPPSPEDVAQTSDNQEEDSLAGLVG
jgi:hypothetical protein